MDFSKVENVNQFDSDARRELSIKKLKLKIFEIMRNLSSLLFWSDKKYKICILVYTTNDEMKYFFLLEWILFLLIKLNKVKKHVKQDYFWMCAVNERKKR